MANITRYFGALLWTPGSEVAERLPCPTGAVCYWCSEAIAADDSGLWKPVAWSADGVEIPHPVHAECDLLGILGRQYGYINLRSRAAAQELVARLAAELEVIADR